MAAHCKVARKHIQVARDSGSRYDLQIGTCKTSHLPAILFIARATWRDFVAEELRWVLFASQEAHLSTAAHIKSLLRPSNSADAISDLSYFLTDSDDSGLASLKV